MTKHFVSSLAPFALGMALVACSADGETPAPVDTDDDQVEAQDDDSSPTSPEDVEPGADAAVDASESPMSDAGPKADARTQSPAPSDDDDEGDDEGDDDADDDDGDDDDGDDGAVADASSSGKDAGAASGDASSVKDAGSERDAGESPKPDPNPGKLTDMVVNETIVVKAGTTFDGTGKRLKAGGALGDGSQDEGQKPVIKVENGGKLVNVTLGAPAADGIHVHGSAILENIVWEDIGEDAMTIKESGTVELRGGSAQKGSDKVFQINAASTFRVSDFKASDAGKFIRQNGKTTFEVKVFIDKCDISNMKEAIFRTQSSVSSVTMTNTRYSNIGEELFMGVSAGNITQMNNTEY